MLKNCFLFIMLVCLISCSEKSETESKIEKVNADFELVRFDREFAGLSESELPALKNKYPFLFPNHYPDSVWVNKMNDTIQNEIETEVGKVFAELTREEDELHSLFQHVKYYFPGFEVPDVYTVTSEVDYKNKVIYTGKYLFVSLDTYLGDDHKFYVGIQEFLKKNFNRKQIVVDASTEIARKYVPKADSRTFLSHMIYYGKLLYLNELFIPFKSDAAKLGYSEEEMYWANANEDQIWRYFVENELLFDTDSELYSRFLYPAPFSKFYLELDAESPSRLGQFIGWNIVKSYMQKNDVSVQRMLNTSAEEIFNKANYKPKK